MAFSIQEIKSALTFGGARASLFSVQIFNPIDASANLKQPFLVRAAHIPASTVGVIEVPYFGRKIKLAGDRDFAPWQVTVIQDEDHLIRNAFENWMSKINTHRGNVRSAGPLPNDYKTNGQVIQYGKVNVPLRQYTFEGLWPSQLSDIALDWSAVDTIEEFTVTFNYDLWTVSGGTTGSGGTNI